MTSRGQCPRGGVLVKNPVSAPGPPPFKNPGSAPEVYVSRMGVGKEGRGRPPPPPLSGEWGGAAPPPPTLDIPVPSLTFYIPYFDFKSRAPL